VNPQFSTSLQDIGKKMGDVKRQVNKILQSVKEELLIDVELVEGGQHTMLFEGKKNDADNAFRKHKGRRKYKTISVHGRKLSFTTDDL
jgi:hypothetical protein